MYKTLILPCRNDHGEDRRESLIDERHPHEAHLLIISGQYVFTEDASVEGVNL